MDEIIIEHANQGNLKDVSLRLPKNKLIAVTGVSGSGKSTLALDVLFNECQRQYLEALGMQGIQKPAVERIQHACAAVCVNAQSGNQMCIRDRYNAFALGELHEFDVSDFTKVDYQPFLTALKRRIEENDKEAGA